jgi:predicted metal-dependent hydrolase
MHVDSDCMALTIEYGSTSIPFELEFRDRKRLSISVHPDQSVTVLAPHGRGVAEILRRVQKRAPWIIKKQVHFEQFQPLPQEKQYVGGETHLYLGRQYRLKLQRREENAVRLVGRYFNVYTANIADADAVRQLLDDWYLEHARKIFDQKTQQCLKLAVSLKLPRAQIQIRKMSKRWGSCTRSGKILLNVELIKTPVHCIEYVIMHERCHLKIHDHSRAFYRLLTRCMPDWEERKRRLDTFVL